MILCQAYGSCSKPDPAYMFDFHISVTAAWIRILGKESRRWSVGEFSMTLMIMQESTLAGRGGTNGGRALSGAGNQRTCAES